MTTVMAIHVGTHSYVSNLIARWTKVVLSCLLTKINVRIYTLLSKIISDNSSLIDRTSLTM